MSQNARDHAYLQIERYVRGLIDQGVGETTPLPSEPALEERFGVSRMTVRHAFQRLVNAGLVVRYPGKGSFARSPTRAQLRLNGQAEPDQWALQGRRIATKILVYETREAPDEVARRFEIPAGSAVTFIERLRYADGQPMSWGQRWLPAGVRETISADSIKGVSLLVLLPQHGYSIKHGLFEIHARPASQEEGKMLEIALRSPVLERRLVFTDGDDRVIVTGRSVYAAARVTYTVNVALQ